MAFTPPSAISHTGSTIKPVRDMASFLPTTLPSLTEHPYHRHCLKKRVAEEIYPSSRGRWFCDVCKMHSSALLTLTGKNPSPWHCDECSFDLCNDCYGIVAKTHHPHPLAKVEPRSPDVYGPKATWTCNRCRKWNPEAISYHCAACKYDLCSNCYFACAHPLHVHPLVLAEGSVCYPEAMYRGAWRCDHCQKTSTLMADQRPYHCSKCKFDLCQTCFKGRKSHLHKHELKLAEGQAVYPSYSGRWICDSCKRMSHLTGERYMWHCSECDFDLCQRCINLDPPPFFVKVQDPATTRVKEGEFEYDESKTCVICMDKKRNALFLHGKTSHLVCCLGCAKEVKKQGQCCPVCRKPIERVVEVFSG